MSDTIYDVAIIGAGHNGLTCACYLARKGLKVAVLEAREVVGGAVSTRTDLIKGFRIDEGSSVHLMVHLSPVVKDLELDKFGLKYLELDPWAYFPVMGTGEGITFHRDLDRTCESIAQFSEKDAETYREQVLHWAEVNESVFASFLQPPSSVRLMRALLAKNLKSMKLFPSVDTLRQVMMPYGQLVREKFENAHVRAALVWLSAQTGPGPEEIASGNMLGWYSMMHTHGARRAKGGSGALTQALAKCFQSYGGEIFTESKVAFIERHDAEPEWSLHYSPPEASEEEPDCVMARKVVGACHVQSLFLELLRDCPRELFTRVSHLRTGNGFGLMVRHAVEELPIYGVAKDPSPVQPYHQGIQLLCPSEQTLHQAHADYISGLPPTRPAVSAMTFSAVDPTLAPEGKHTLYLWGQYHPYTLSNREKWDEIRDREADKLYDVLCRYAPNMKGKVIERFIQTPLDLHREMGLVRGNLMHLTMSLDQMFFFRPLPELSSYRTPLPGLYLTGASTHPGGGVLAASGYNTAQVILSDLAG